MIELSSNGGWVVRELHGEPDWSTYVAEQYDDDMTKDDNKWKGLVAEILPLLISDVHNGLMIGPPPDGHIDDGCADCRWYQKSLEWDKRIRSGEFEDLINLDES